MPPVLSTRAPISVTIEVQGARATAQHFNAIASFTGQAAQGAVAFAGDYLTNLAKEIHRPHILSSDTFDSISPDERGVYRDGGGWSVDVGPETPQSIFLEWGFIHHRSNQWVQYPFMIPAAELTAPLFVQAMTQIVEVAANRRAFSTPLAPPNALDAFRGSLYSFSKFAGDIQVFGFGGLAPIRGAALTTARLTGDIQSSMRGAIGTRIERRVAGSFASGGLRASVSARISGPTASQQNAFGRVYNRVAGRITGRGIGGTF